MKLLIYIWKRKHIKSSSAICLLDSIVRTFMQSRLCNRSDNSIDLVNLKDQSKFGKVVESNPVKRASRSSVVNFLPRKLSNKVWITKVANWNQQLSKPKPGRPKKATKALQRKKKFFSLKKYYILKLSNFSSAILKYLFYFVRQYTIPSN